VRLRGAPAELRLDEGSGVAVVSGSLPAQRPIELALDERGPLLQYGWGASADWPAVGAWYRDLVSQVPRGSAAVRALAERVAAGARGRLAVERLLAFVQREVRYVAVEVGVGGYRPGMPEEVLSRRWGDCKDKALLLVDLLAAVGIDARVALVRASESGDVDADFPAPDQFNHLVVALPAGTVADPASAAAPAGWVFVDPTQGRGGLDWLHPWLAGHRALVVTPAGGELAAVPLDPSRETERLTVDLAVAGDGAASGTVRLELRGAAADALGQRARSERPETVLADAQRLLGAMLPGVSLSRIRVEAAPDGPPEGRVGGAISLAVSLTQLSGGAEGDRSLLVPAEPATPSPSLLAERSEPVVLSPSTIESEWRIALPWSGCRLEPAAAAFEGSAGSFRQEATLTGTSLVLRRRTELRAWQVGPEGFGDLRSLALAEHRTLKRRLRLVCAAG
jgi:hypothetical protein